MQNDKSRILRYAELALRQQSQRERKQEPFAEDIAQMEQIKRELGLSHQAILEMAAKNLIDEDE